MDKTKTVVIYKGFEDKQYSVYMGDTIQEVLLSIIDGEMDPWEHNQWGETPEEVIETYAEGGYFIGKPRPKRKRYYEIDAMKYIDYLENECRGEVKAAFTTDGDIIFQNTSEFIFYSGF